jgi:acyl transferase domain-containing protein
MTRKAALVVCPGRGTYNRDELGYLARYHVDKAAMLTGFDAARSDLNQQTLSALDGASTFSVSQHTRGDNASALIYACAYADFLSIDRATFEIVAVTGNSMGWYTALACAGALNAEGGFQVVNTMGTLMQEALIGGQMLYPFVDENWEEVRGKRAELLELTECIPDLYASIHLGGMIVFAGGAAALDAAGRSLEPVQGRFPMRLANHAGFHSPLQAPVSVQGKARLAPELFGQPSVSLVDGRGHVWLPKGSARDALWDYTLGHQVIAPYDFTAAVRTGLREFAPDVVIVLGPGQTLGGAVGQCLIAEGWLGLSSKRDFVDLQATDPFVLSMGMDEQRRLVLLREM